MTIKIKISELLGKHKMSQKELAEKTKIRPATISALFHEKIKRIDIGHIDELCKVFGCTPGDLFEYIPDGYISSANNMDRFAVKYSNPPYFKDFDSLKPKVNNMNSVNDMELAKTEQGIIISEKNVDKNDTYKLTRQYIEEIIFDIIRDKDKKNN